MRGYKKTNGDPKKIMAEYKLKGETLNNAHAAIAFSAPFAVRAVVDARTKISGIFK